MRKVFHDRISTTVDLNETKPSNSLSSTTINPSPLSTNQNTSSPSSIPSSQSTPKISSSKPIQTVGDNFIRLNLKRRLNVKHRIHSKKSKTNTNLSSIEQQQKEQQEEDNQTQSIHEKSGTGPGLLEEEILSMYIQQPSSTISESPSNCSGISFYVFTFISSSFMSSWNSFNLSCSKESR